MRRTKSLFGLHLTKTRNTAHLSHGRHGSNKNGKSLKRVFSVLVDQYRMTDIRANTITGFEVALDGILLVYSLVTLGLVER